MENAFFFDGWSGVGRVVLTAALSYPALVLMLRLSGKRTLSKLNAFDLVVTVALGSTLATVIVSGRVPIANGIAALLSLVALQYAVAWLTTRSRRFDRLVKSEPQVLFYRGAFARRALRRERITEDAVLSAVRRARVGLLDEVEVVVLEASGDLSVVRRTGAREGRAKEALGGVRFDGVRDDDAGHARA